MDALQVTQTIMDEYSARILLGTFDRPASAIELGRRFGIPIAACYRRIKELEGLGLVYGERAEPSRNGRGPQLYRSRLRSVHITFEDGKLRARVVLASIGVAAGLENEVTEQVMNLHGLSSTV
ncbi:MAG: winged helix-turn-helix transcriptional regulator [Methanobacteriota archaeon]|nr:MAG: winged helix-turn-helix transcriptional regulator [Euryarchaeota archaeon]